MRSAEFTCPASFAQERLWFLDRFHPGSPAYNVPAIVPLPAVLDEGALTWSLREIVRRHEALRTCFRLVEGQPMQVIRPRLELPLQVFDLRRLGEQERQQATAEHTESEARLPFDLEQGPLIRARLLKRGTDHLLLITLHHIIADGWALGVLFRELRLLYEARCRGEAPALAEPPIQYADYTHWQRERLQGSFYASLVDWWRKQLQGAPAVLELPTDRPRPKVPSFRGATHFFQLSTELSRRIEELSQREGATLFMTLLTAFKVLLYRYSRCDDLVVGTPIANRNRVELEGLIGFFANTLVLRTRLSGSLTFREALRRVRETTLGAFDHQDMPFERLVGELQPERYISRNPLFQVMFSLQNTPTLRTSTMPSAELPGTTSKFDLALLMGQSSEGLVGGLEYSTDLFDKVTIQRMYRQLVSLLESVVAQADQRIADLSLLGPGDLEELARLGQAEEPLPRERHCLHTWVEASAERNPAAVALRFQGEALSYGELERRACRLARLLVERGLGPGRRVGICMERGPGPLIALLAVLKAGAAYVPLDPSYPAQRLAWMVEDAGLSLILTEPAFKGVLEPLGVETLEPGTTALPREEGPLGVEVGLESLAYIVFTSGSTGRPKAVGMTHSGVANLVGWMAERGPRRTLQFASLGFDVSVQEIFVTWAAGGTVVALPESIRQDPGALLHLLEEERIERLFLPPVVLHQLTQSSAGRGLPASLREIITAGEQLRVTPEIATLFAALPQCSLINQYGPCETHVVTEHRLTGDPSSWPVLPPIGRPIPGSRVLVLDEALRPVPPGLPGELYLGGQNQGLGYIADAARTAERFVADVSGLSQGGRLYRTGDLGRFLPSGEIAFLGRLDHQVKLRGFRVEPGEVDAVLQRCPGVEEAATVVREVGGDKRLVSYVVASPSTLRTATELRSHCRQFLPDYMVPSAFVLLDRLPLTRHGKLDRAALPAPEPTRPELEQRFVAPRTPMEALLARLWCEVLGLERVGVYDSFFELGGHSLLAIRLLSRVRDECGVDIPLQELFERPTLADFAPVLVLHKTAPLEEEDMTRLLQELEAMSDEEAQALLSG
jgi:amino acid adenylation domain-containing protein